jgi:hypothetical protein
MKELILQMYSQFAPDIKVTNEKLEEINTYYKGRAGLFIRDFQSKVLNPKGVYLDRDKALLQTYDMQAQYDEWDAIGLAEARRRRKEMSYWIREAKNKYNQGYGLDELGPEYLEIAVQALSLGNIPADRVRQLFQNYYNTFDFSADYEAHERVLMFLGWPDYQIPGAPDSRESREQNIQGDGRVNKKRVNKKRVGNKRINR